MRNTGITYGSDEQKLQILQEFAELLPPLTEEQRQALEADILQNGCYSPIITDTELHIVDGHNRQRICEKHNLPYTMAVFEFADKLEAMQWALDTQKGRRNLDKWELGKIALKLKPEIEARAKANQSLSGGDRKSDAAKSIRLNSDESISNVDTRQQLADSVGLGRDTMSRIIKIDEKAPEAVKQALDKGELSVNKGYELTKKLEAVPEEEREAAAAEALEYEKAKKSLAQKNAEIDRQGKIAAQFSKAFEKAIMLEVTEENVRVWTDCCRMREDEIADSAKEARQIAEAFGKIAEIIEDKILPPGYFDDEEGDEGYDDDNEYNEYAGIA